MDFGTIPGGTGRLGLNPGADHSISLKGDAGTVANG